AGQEIRKQRQSVAVGEKRQQLGENRRETQPRCKLCYRGALARDGDRRIEQHTRERRVLFEQVGESGELLLDELEVSFFFDGHVKKRSGVTDGRASSRHASASCDVSRLRRVSQAAGQPSSLDPPYSFGFFQWKL